MELWLIILISVLGVFIGLPCFMIILMTCYMSFIKNRAPEPLNPKWKDKRAIVKCLCGETEIHFRNWMPRMRGECMCYDCTQRWDW